MFELAYTAAGPEDGRPAILLHGLFDHWRSFAPVLERLPAGVRAYALTQRGHTGGPQPDSGYAVADLAADALGFLDARGADRALLAGHSLGALVALQAAIDAPERVSGLVLAPGFAAGAAVPAIGELRAAVGERIEPEFAAMLQEEARRHGLFDAMVDHTVRMPARAARALLDGIAAFDVRAALPRVRARTLVLWGAQDEIVPRAEAERLATGIPGAQLRVLDGCGHTPHWHDPLAFARALSAWNLPRAGAVAP